MLAAITGSRTKNFEDLPCYNGDQHGQETLQACHLSATTYLFHNDTYQVPLAPDDQLQADARTHYIYTCERRVCQRNREALLSLKLKSIWTAVPWRQNILHLFTDTTRFIKRLTIVSFSEFSDTRNKNCVRDNRTKVSRKLKSCCHEDREDPTSSFFCFQF